MRRGKLGSDDLEQPLYLCPRFIQHFPSSPMQTPPPRPPPPPPPPPLTITIFSTRLLDILLRFGNCPLFAVVYFMTSLTSPRALYWYAYPVILLLFYLPTDRFVKHALHALEAIIPIRIPNIPNNQVYDILINATVGGINEPHKQQQDDEPNSETLDLEANIEAEQ